MLKKEMINGLRKASPEKRYKSFLNTVADSGNVWLLASEEGYATIDVEGYIYVMVWPHREFCEFMQSEDEKPVSMEVHNFLENCSKLNASVRFIVFPTEANAYMVSAEQLCADIQDHLDEVE